MSDASGVAADRLRSLVERIERLEAEKAEIANDIKEIYQEAKSAGFETKIIRQVVKLRKLDAQERAEQEQLLDIYMGAIGMLAGTPLGEASKPKRDIGKRRAELDGDDDPREALKSSIDNLTKEPGAAISITSGGITTMLKNVDGTRVLEQTGEPPQDMGPPPRMPSPAEQMDALKASKEQRTIDSAVSALKQQLAASA